ncbi:MAG: hypothetical protein ACRCUJ_07090 [Phocaeicola sp.]
MTKLELKIIWQNACYATDNARIEWITASNQDKPQELVALYWGVYMDETKAEKIAFDNYFHSK